MDEHQYILETRQLTKTYRKTDVVKNVNLCIQEGEIYGFLGPNGAGKTTTIRMLLGLINPTKGETRIFGKDLKSNRLDILRNVGSLVESPSYYPHLTGEENLEAIRKILNVPKSNIDDVLEMVRLTKMADKKAGEYSLGMKQRLGIAAALLGYPKLVILDEPTNGLDPAGILEIRELILRLPSDYGITVMISSHLLSEIEQVATQVGIIANGEMLFQDAIGELRSKADTKIVFSTSDTDGALDIFSREGVEAVKTQRGLMIEDRTDMEISRLARKLFENEIDIFRIYDESKSLEDIFLDMTKGGETL
ncbi:ABC transporter ATP-binding protein [Bacillus paralicheniformis]|jgi:ABC-2 type transport system ATP-binding protein|uniref:ABC transporter ATP-binding protein n=3 Tax=Bacillus subtilis group TaxID=653685 RepID=A0AAW6KEC9_9BACI|nr:MULTISPECIES: ABC transporter ATP-binding protein [Bacillus]KUL13544.1 bacitracin ABC transporter ATP-binding protein [Bacillus licheniformis LMG 7559]KUL17719.1 bacitracin ABC transporter ATP-binding protein [Bacillus licheniformis LMG 6934]AGN34607.1 putative ABC transporter ATP-binding protein [Bacillus paralicheniformis ATCC 9945a]AJO16298.1 ABC transporter ATP-binding protein [Bacillus paralicheniformis]ARA84142.1 bacitracin ABC transporter ATP-binding protein [Bacillus paralicheniform